MRLRHVDLSSRGEFSFLVCVPFDPFCELLPLRPYVHKANPFFQPSERIRTPTFALDLASPGTPANWFQRIRAQDQSKAGEKHGDEGFELDVERKVGVLV